MKVQFEATQDDLIDATQRFLARSKQIRSWRWKDLLYSSVLFGLIGFLVYALQGRPMRGVACGILIAMVTALLHIFHQRGRERRLRKFYQERLGTSVPFVCEVELTPVGVWVRQLNTQSILEWEIVAEVTETGDSVDIYTRNGGGVVVRKRAFSSAEEQAKFVATARGYLELSAAATSESAPQLTKG